MVKIANCIVVDDEEVDRLMVVSYVIRHPQLCLIGSFGSAGEALATVDFSQIDVVFLDIDMGGMDGISFRSAIAEVPACIFVTSYPEYAVDSFSVETLDFIVKPISQDRFDSSVKRLQTFLEICQKANLYELHIGGSYIHIKEGHHQVKLDLQDILYLEGLKDYTLLVTEAKNYCVLSSIGNLLKELDFSSFVRIHRSFAVRKELIKSVSSVEVLLTNDMTIPIGRSFKDNILYLIS